METQSRSIHPMILIAAASVTLVSLTGMAALAGWLPAAQPSGPAPTTRQMAMTPQSAIAAAPEQSATLNIPAGSKVTVHAASASPTGLPAARQPARAAVRPVAAALPSSAAVAEPPYGARGATPVASYPQQDSGIFVEHSRQTVGACRDCGTVESIREVKQEAAGTGLGAIAGGVLGGLLGNQVGKGRGHTVGAVVGALGGAFAGHEVEKQVRATQQYQVTVRLDDGSVRTFSETQAPVWHDGDRVRIANNGQIGGI